MSGSKVNAIAAKHLSLVSFCFFALSYNADLFPRNLVMKMKNVFGPLQKVALFHGSLTGQAYGFDALAFCYLQSTGNNYKKVELSKVKLLLNPKFEFGNLR